MDNKKFWKNIKPLFSKKDVYRYKITLVSNNEIITDDSAVAETLNTFFWEAVNSLDIGIDTNLLNKVPVRGGCQVEQIIEKFSSHPSILKINEKVSPVSFGFTEVSLQDIEHEIECLNPKKGIPSGSIPTKVIIDNKDILAKSLHSFVNNNINTGNIPNSLKLGDIAAVFKKGDATSVSNYRPVSVLPAISKIYERVLQKQLLNNIDVHLSKFLCG